MTAWLTDTGAFAVAVTKDAVVPTLSARNPLLKELLARGLKKEEFVGLWITKTVTSWDALLGRKGKAEKAEGEAEEKPEKAGKPEKGGKPDKGEKKEKK